MSGHLWCEFKNMWCSDTDEEDYADMNCDGDCKGCIFSEVVGNEEKDGRG